MSNPRPKLRPSLRNALLSGASLVTLLASQPVFAQTVSGIRGTAATGTRGNSGGGSSNGAPVTTLPPTAQAALTRQNAIKARVATALDLANQAQAVARTAALTKPSTIPNGIATGGLMPAGAIKVDQSLWQNANAPTQTVGADGKINVEIDQTAAKAILTWDSFNVGKDTTVYFNQSAGQQKDGSNEWIALNRILDPSLKPSQIQGQIKAEGTVYLINRNGIIFTGSSQVNTQSLLVSSLAFLGENQNDPASVAAANQLFLTKGFSSGGIPSPQNMLGFTNGTFFRQGTPQPMIPGDITVEAGAQIETEKNGYTLLAGIDVNNAGSVVANGGTVTLLAGWGAAGIDPRHVTPTGQFFESLPTGGVIDLTPVSTVNNTGIVSGILGNATLTGGAINQNGIVLATTGVLQPGSVTIRAVDQSDSSNDLQLGRPGVATFGTGSLTAILPDSNGGTTTSSQAADDAFTPGSANVMAGTIWFQQDSTLYMPGAALILRARTGPKYSSDLAALNRIYIDDGAIVSVAGLADVERPMSDNLVTIARVGQNELADSPLERDSILYRSPFIVDGRDTGTRDDGLSWVGSPVVNASGYVQGVPRTTEQMLINGGTIDMSSTSDIVATAGSIIDVSGGFLHYLGGSTTTSRLIGVDGRVYSAANADPMMTYVGFAGQTTVDHSRWGVTDNYSNSLMSGGYESDYVQGGNGGTLSVTTIGNQIANAGVALLTGEIDAQTIIGRHQISSGDLPKGSTLSLQGNDAVGPAYRITADGISLSDIAPGFGVTTSLQTPALLALATSDPDNILFTSNLSAKLINAAGFGSVVITGTGKPVTVDAGVTLAIQPGGSIALSGGLITVLGTLSAPSGNISLTSTGAIPSNANSSALAPGDITIGSSARLDASGQWVNDRGSFTDPVGDNYVNGGSVSLIALANFNGGTADLTGSVILNAGSVIDVSSGGYVTPFGQLGMANGVPLGTGGSIALQTYYTDPRTAALGALNVGNLTPYRGRLVIDGTLEAYGFAGGGTLSLQALQAQIGGDLSGLPDYGLYLPAEYFMNQGFGNYVVSGAYSSTVAAGTTVRVSQRNLLPNSIALAGAATGTDIFQPGYTSLGTVDTYYRQPTSFTLSAGSFENWSTSAVSANPPSLPGVTGEALVDEGASILADPGASVTVSGSHQAVVLGAIVAPGGSITVTNPFSFENINAIPSTSHSAWLGADALLDVSGVVLTDPYAAPIRSGNGTIIPTTGRVLDGGSVTLRSENGYVIAQDGARIDVSGTSDTLDLRSGNGYAATQVWSDAGSITLGATSGMMFDATIDARGGAPQARGGTLTIDGTVQGTTFGTIVAPTASGVLLQQSGDLAQPDWQPGDQLENSVSGILHFVADRLNGSGIDTMIVGYDPTVGFDPTGLSKPLTNFTMAFAGDVNINLGRAFIAEAQNYQALAPGGSGSTGAGHVTIAAPYVAIGGPGTTPTLLAGDGVLNVSASMIDLMGQFTLRGFAQANFTSSGDIRLYTPLQFLAGAISTPGELITAGDLTFKAAQLYPATGNVFILDAPSADSTITFLGNGSTPPPLSVGGALLVDAANIVQDGTLRAPSGTIQLGVGDPTDASTKTAFNNLTLVKTSSVTLGDGSLTSVSLDGRSLPYGTTADGTDWKLVVAGGTGVNGTIASADLTGTPAKLIGIAGDNVDLGKGATIDLSGGGDIYAQEFVPGTGGSRDLLSTVNTVYSTGATPTKAPLYADGRQIYAVVPGYAAPVAAYDASFDQGGSQVGKAVYLSGVKGLPDGIYTLLPGQYATLPGAFRVVQQTQITDSVASNNYTQPDGGQIVSGRFVDALSGSTAARTTSFLVQSQAVWEQYSEYTITHASDYFPKLADHNGTTVSRLPADAGRLALSAVAALALDGTLKTGVGTDGRGAEVDISAQDIQILGGGGEARDGYLQIDATALSKLGAESLLIGGTRSEGPGGTTINVASNSVILSNDASSALTGPEITLVTKTDPSGTDANAVNGLLIESGSVIAAKGNIAVPSTAPILIGALDGASGDGALLRVSNGGAVPVIRSNVPGLDGVVGTAAGLLDIKAGASIGGGDSTILDSTGDLRLAAGASFIGKAVDINANSVAFLGSGATATPGGLVVDQSLIGQFAAIATLGLHSRSTMDFYGDVALTLGQNLTLGAAAFTSDGGTVSITAPTLALVNDIAGDATFTSGTGTLALSAGELDLGTGTKTLQGFGSITATATKGVVGQGTGSLDLGSLDATFIAPVFTADSNASNGITTTGALTLASGAGTATDRATFGGALRFTGGTLNDTALITVPAGNVSLHATSGDLAIGDGALIEANGVAKPFRDVTAYAPGGAITLTADQGSVLLSTGATLDFSAAAGGGDAGSLTVSAPTQTAQLLGTIKGSAAKGNLGGSFSLDTGGAVDLDALVKVLAASGVSNRVSVHSRAGNLTLSASDTLKAQAVTLTADGGDGTPSTTDGNVLIAGTIDASGAAGGSIALAGKSGVTLTGSLIATGSDPNRRGGNVSLQTSGVASGGLDPTYGYEQVSVSGAINIGAGALIDVSGGSFGGLSGGTVEIRTPLLVGGDVNVTIDKAATIKGARDVGLEAYAVWSTTDNQPDKSKYFDGIIDPAGWYNTDGSMVTGSWTDVDGNPLSAPTSDQLADYLARDYFTPDSPNLDHATFYGFAGGDADAAQPGTLMGFVENPGFTFESRFADIANFNARPGIELRNPDTSVNGGNISILTPWNLGAGATDSNGIFHALFRYDGQAPILTLRANNNITIKASITDGFEQFNLIGGTGGGGANGTLGDGQNALALLVATEMSNWGYDGSGFASPVVFDTGNPVAIQQYYGLYSAYIKMLSTLDPNLGLSIGDLVSIATAFGTTPAQPGTPTAPLPATSAKDYAAYLGAYTAYAAEIWKYVLNDPNNFVPDTFTPPVPPPTTLDLLPVATNNTPAPVGTVANPLPVHSANLIAGQSSSYRLVAGADLSSAVVDAVRPASTQDGGGNVAVDGHLIWTDPATSVDIPLPTIIRTGTGSIDVAAGGNIVLLDNVAPGVIYTAGAPAPGTALAASTSIFTTTSNGSSTTVETLVTGEVHPEGAGDITLAAQSDIIGNQQIYDMTGSITRFAGTYYGQYWWPWMETGNPQDANFAVTASSINFAAFDQGVMSVGGNINITAGNDIRELQVSLPTTWYRATDDSGAPIAVVVGGGNLSVNAGNDILSGSYFVSKGEGRIAAGGEIGSAFDFTSQLNGGHTVVSPVSTLLALQDAVLNVSARGTVDIGGIYNPSWVETAAQLVPSDSQTYSTRSAVNLTSTSGDARLDTLTTPRTLFHYGFGEIFESTAAGPSLVDGYMLPASLSMTALNGSVYIGGAGQLFPSPTGNLTLLAQDNVYLQNLVNGNAQQYGSFGLSDAPDGFFPSPLDPITFSTKWYAIDPVNVAFNGFLAHQAGLHILDPDPVRIYSLGGDIVNGFAGGDSLNDGLYGGGLTLVLPKPSQLYAGRDILNLNFFGQNLFDSDVTSIVAGRDIFDTPYTDFVNPPPNDPVPVIEIGGPGRLDIIAGRDVGPFVGNQPVTGIEAIGNAQNGNLLHGSADISVLFGTGPGVAWDAFANAYLDPASPPADLPSLANYLVDGVAQYQADLDKRAGGVGTLPTLTPDQAWTAFQTMPEAQREAMIQKVFFKILAITSADVNNPASPDLGKYARGYQAIETLFPANLGYTKNNLEGGVNGAATQVSTGNLDIRGSTIQTQEGGDINIMGPGGQVLIGSSASPPYVVDSRGNVLVGPQAQGVLAWETGSINIFADQSVLLAQSRIFTERGGDMTIWSSNGDVNAGKGAKTTSEQQPNTYICSPEAFCRIDAGGAVTGAGIAAFPAAPGDPAPTVTLAAPRGTVDFGDAGVRVAGNLIVAAQAVANADNVQVTGTTIGVPTNEANVSANLAASNSAATAAQEAASIMQKVRQNDQPSIVIVTINGFG